MKRRRFLDFYLGPGIEHGPGCWKFGVYWFPNYYAVPGQLGWWHAWELVWFVRRAGCAR